MLRFHFDEHVAHAIAKALRARGIDVTTAAESGLRGASDPEHLSFAWQNARVIFTNDDDFLVMAANEEQHAGIAYCKVGVRSIGYTVDALLFLSDALEPNEMLNRVEYL